MNVIGKHLKTAALGTVVGGSLLLTAGLGLAHAQPPPPPPAPGTDGLIDVVVGNSPYLSNVPTMQAAQAVSQMCAIPVPAATALVDNADRAGGRQTACTGRPNGDVVLVQNQPAGTGASPVVPGTKAHVKSSPAQDTPAGGGEITGSLPTNPDNMSSLN